MRIAMDIDGVTANLAGGFERLYQQAFDKPMYFHDGSWDLHAGTVFESERTLFSYLDRVPNFWRDLPLMPGAAGGCYQLVEGGNIVTFVTNRSSEQQRLQTREWLDAWWPERKNTPTVEFVPGYKGMLDFQAYVEDNPTRIDELVNGWKTDDTEWARKPFVVVFDQPWNRDIPDADNLWRVKGWSELLDLLMAVATRGLDNLPPKTPEKTTTKKGKADGETGKTDA